MAVDGTKDVCSLTRYTEGGEEEEALILKWVLGGNEEDEESKLMAASMNGCMLRVEC